MDNPYEVTPGSPSAEDHLPRPVFRLAVTSLFAIAFGGCISLPGLFLLHAKFFPLASGGIEVIVGGRTVSNDLVMAIDLVVSSFLVLGGIYLGIVSRNNHLFNRKSKD